MKLKKETKLLLILFSTYIFLNSVFILYCIFINTNYVTEVPDQGNFVTRGSGILSGLLPYRDFYTNAAPLSPYVWSIIVLISSLLVVKFDFVVRFFFSLCLILSSLILFKIQKKKNNPKAFIMALVYGLNPFFLYLNVIWGGDECILPLLILIPIFLFEENKPVLGTITIALGAGIKYYPVLLAPLIWAYFENWKKRTVGISLFVLLVGLIYIPFYFIAPEEFLFQFKDPVQETFGGNQGILSVIQAFFNLDLEKYNLYFKITTIIVLFICGIFFLFRREDNYMDAFPFLLIFLIFYPKFQISYVVLLFPFIIEYIFIERKIYVSTAFYTLSLVYGDSANSLMEENLSNLAMIILYWLIVLVFYLLAFSLLVMYFSTTKKISSEQKTET
ncbi:MAG: glycosyltransferase 87 family protein [Candidatus Heimdallarchaeum aukensis]|uniref:Glycosyltransferase 87 family protein n=1 Tax=Candidatus Heimdallarchaeum aukensis TaxID=2876573 RepID=A0A9Y1BMU8_9ARCH|nr:MAG: glycosyltransferase 87 family protein [Candidatus Heimdallarchaeum aukensis]